MLKTRERKRDRKAGGKRMKATRKAGGKRGKRGEKWVEAGRKRMEAGGKRGERGWNRERIEQRADTPAGMPALLCVLKRGSAYWAGDITTSNTLPAATSLARSA